MAMKHIDGLLYWAPTPKVGGGWVCHKDSPEPPATPDPAVVSGQQTKSNIQTAQANAALNRVNQYTPYGSITYKKSGNGQKAENWLAEETARIQAEREKDPEYARMAADPVWKAANMKEFEAEMAKKVNPYADEANEWTSTVELSPEQKALYDQDLRIKTQLGNVGEQGLGRVGAAMGKEFDTSGLTGYRDIPTADGSSYTRGLTGGNIQRSLPNSDYSKDRTRIEEALYSRLNPQLERDRNALDVKLANQGIMPGSEAYREAIDETNRAATDARYGAILAGGQEQSRLAGLDLNAGQFANSAQQQDFNQQLANANLNNGVSDTLFNQGMAGAQATAQQRQQQMQEAAYLRSMPLNELNALRTGTQVQNPQFSAVPQTNVGNTNTSGNTWQAQQGMNNTYNQQVASNNANTQAATSAAAAGLSAWGSAAGAGLVSFF